MSRPALEVADIVRTHGDEFVNRYRHQLSYQQMKALNAIERCRTAALGGHIDECSACGHTAVSYNSCRNRHCPKCQAQARQRWLAARERELLDTPYFHVVFTLPHSLAALCRTNAELLYNLLFRTSAQTMMEVAADPKHLGAEIGFLGILHTWGQNLTLHPHVHCIVPAGGFSPDHSTWIRPRYPFFLPVKVLSRVFRGKFVEGLKRAYRNRALRLTGAVEELNERSKFQAFVNGLFRQDWVVYAKPAMGGPVQALRYLGRYTHRVAISNHRLTAFDGDRVTFRWKDYAHGNKQRRMTLTAAEFLRRFLQHVLPRGFVRIRHFGFLVNRCREPMLALARQLLANTPKPREPCPASPQSWLCPRCGAGMKIGPALATAMLPRLCSFNDSS